MEVRPLVLLLVWFRSFCQCLCVCGVHACVCMWVARLIPCLSLNSRPPSLSAPSWSPHPVGLTDMVRPPPHTQAGTAAMEAITSVLEGPLCWCVKKRQRKVQHVGAPIPFRSFIPPCLTPTPPRRRRRRRQGGGVRGGPRQGLALPLAARPLHRPGTY